jgi:hypothetical protein
MFHFDVANVAMFHMFHVHVAIMLFECCISYEGFECSNKKTYGVGFFLIFDG